MRKSRWWIGVLSFLWLVPGCIVQIGDDDGDGDAVLVTEWSIEDSFDPEQCTRIGAVDLEMVVYDRFNDVVLQAEIACEANGMEVRMDEGVYDIEFRLIDRRGRSVTEIITRSSVRLRDYRDEVISIDFSSDLIL